MKKLIILILLGLSGLSYCQSGFTLGNGTNFGIDYVAIPPRPHLKSWDTSACVSTPAGALALGRGFSVEADALGGLNLRVDAFTAGYALDLAYSFKLLTVGNALSFQLKGGGAQLYGAGINPRIGFNGSISLNIALR